MIGFFKRWFQKPVEKPVENKKTSSVRHVYRRNFGSALVSRLTADFSGSHSSIESDIRASIRLMRDRCRQLAKDNGYIIRYLKLCRSNIVGSQGFLLKNKAKQPDGRPNRSVNRLIENAWWKWTRSCDVTGKLSFRQVCNLVVNCKKVDGEALVIKHFRRGKFELEVCDVDRLDETYDRVTLENGNRISMGVEIDPLYKPIAYHVLQSHPTDFTSNRFLRVRLPANRVYHIFESDRPGQPRGVPEIQAAILDLNQLSGYKEAELTAARVAASKMGFYTTDGSEQYDGEREETGEIIDETSPGTFVELPQGKNFVPFDPQHPMTAFGAFIDSCVRIIASALGISYSALANDITKANYSSMRQDALLDRDNWKNEQEFLIESFVMPVFVDWFTHFLLTGNSGLQFSDFEEICQPVFRGRGWAWVDPLKEVNAHKVALETKLKSREAILAETGEDVEELFTDLKAEAEMASEFGLSLANASDQVSQKEFDDEEE